MLAIDELDDEVLTDILNNLGFDEASDQEQTKLYCKVENMSVQEALDCFLQWYGIVGYTDLILKAVRSLDKSEMCVINGED